MSRTSVTVFGVKRVFMYGVYVWVCISYMFNICQNTHMHVYVYAQS